MHKRISLLHIAFITCTLATQATNNDIVNTLQETKEISAEQGQVTINETGLTKELTDLVILRQALAERYAFTGQMQQMAPITLCQDKFEERITNKLTPLSLCLKKEEFHALVSSKTKDELLSLLQKNEHMIIHYKSLLSQHYTQHNQALSDKIKSCSNYIALAWLMYVGIPELGKLHEAYRQNTLNTTNATNIIMPTIKGIITIYLGSAIFYGISSKSSHSIKTSLEKSQASAQAIANTLKKITSVVSEQTL